MLALRAFLIDHQWFTACFLHVLDFYTFSHFLLPKFGIMTAFPSNLSHIPAFHPPNSMIAHYRVNIPTFCVIMPTHWLMLVRLKPLAIHAQFKVFHIHIIQLC